MHTQVANYMKEKNKATRLPKKETLGISDFKNKFLPDKDKAHITKPLTTWLIHITTNTEK